MSDKMDLEATTEVEEGISYVKKKIHVRGSKPKVIFSTPNESITWPLVLIPQYKTWYER